MPLQWSHRTTKKPYLTSLELVKFWIKGFRETMPLLILQSLLFYNCLFTNASKETTKLGRFTCEGLNIWWNWEAEFTSSKATLHSFRKYSGILLEQFQKYPLAADQARRADFELALHFGTDPLFPASEIPGQDVLTALRNNLFHEQTHNSVQIPSLPTSSYELRDIFLDVLSIDHYLQTRVDIMSKLKPELFQAILIKVCYKLIDNWSVHAQECTNSFEDLLRLTLMAFMITFWYPWGKKSEMFPSLYTRFRKVIEATSQDLVGSESFLLWAVLIGKCSIFSAESDSWLIPIFVKIAKGLELHTWKDTLHAIHGLPWIKFLHEKSGRKLFNDSKAESIQIPSTSNHIWFMLLASRKHWSHSTDPVILEVVVKFISRPAKTNT